MKSVCRVGLAPVASLATLVAAQGPSTLTPDLPLVLTGAIPLQNGQGRVDHFGFDSKGRLFISALANNTEEVPDLVAGTRSQRIGGIARPQGVVYTPELNKLFVGSDEGKLYIYDGTSFILITAIDFGDDVDNLRYDAVSKRGYVGFGDDESGAIGIVDATTNQRLSEEFKLGRTPSLADGDVRTECLCEPARPEPDRSDQSQHASDFPVAFEPGEQLSDGPG